MEFHFFVSDGKVMASDGKVMALPSLLSYAAISLILIRYQNFYMQNEAMEQGFHSSIKYSTNMADIIEKFNNFKTDFFWSKIIDLCSKMS